jgi:hypothetical protein
VPAKKVAVFKPGKELAEAFDPAAEPPSGTNTFNLREPVKIERSSEHNARSDPSGLKAPFFLAPVIFTEFMDFVVVAKVAMVAVLPNVASVAVEERVVPSAIRELDTGVASVCHGRLGLKKWLQCEHRQKQGDDREDRLGVKVNAHVSASVYFRRFRTFQIQHV